MNKSHNLIIDENNRLIKSYNEENNDRIILLTKEKLENKNTIDFLQDKIKNLNNQIHELKQENEIYKIKSINMSKIIQDLKIKETKSE